MLMYALSLWPLCAGWMVRFALTARARMLAFSRLAASGSAADCRKQFSVKTGTIFEESPIALDKWLMAIWLVVNCKNGISSYEIARDLKVTQKSAWFMLHRIRLALKNGSWAKLGGTGGPVEVDETFIGGKPKNMHTDQAGFKMEDCGMNGYARERLSLSECLTVTLGRYGRKWFPTSSVRPCRKRSLTASNSAPPSIPIGWLGYDGLKRASFIHETVNHVDEYVRGNVHTQGIENFWSLLKRGSERHLCCRRAVPP